MSQLPKDYADCIAWARLQFEEHFNHKIKQLLHNFPLDRVTSTGVLFWSGAKKPPKPLEFDYFDPLHLEFIESVANVRAEMFGVKKDWSRNNAVAILETLAVPEFRAEEGAKIPTNDEEAKAQAEARNSEVDVETKCAGLIQALKSLKADSRPPLLVIDFDKDLDLHMRAVASCSNLRARNYAIPEADLHTSRGIAGRIVPAIATTTALVTGFICLEIYKILQNKPLSSFANTFTNLAICLFTSMEPEPPKITTSVIKGKEWKFSPWDKIVVDTPDITLNGLIRYLDEEYGLSLNMLSSGVSILYSDFMNKKKMAERMDMSVKQVYESVTKTTLPSSTKYLVLEVIANDLETDEEVDLPYLRLSLY